MDVRRDSSAEKPILARRRTAWLPRALLALLLLCCQLGVPVAADDPQDADPIVIVTRRDLSLDRLSSNSLRSIFALRLRNWPNGTPVKVFTLSDSDPIHERFCREVLGIYGANLRAAWDRVIFTGLAASPNVMPTEGALLDAVAHTPGAIGYARRSEVTDAVKVLYFEQGR